MTTFSNTGTGTEEITFFKITDSYGQLRKEITIAQIYRLVASKKDQGRHMECTTHSVLCNPTSGATILEMYLNMKTLLYFFVFHFFSSTKKCVIT